MCGIFGFSNRVENPKEVLQLMGDSMIHRGPDGDGYFINETISMGMRRLSIIDVEKGNQPFYSQSRQIVVMCNGEIYNHKDLRRELISDGYTFKTSSDIEVLPHLYEKYGIEFVKKLNGMFSIALYDNNKKIFYLIRDRLGIKPLYYSIKNSQLAYASELKSLLKIPGFEKNIDFDALSTYLDLMYIPRPLSPFKKVQKLDSGSYLLWDGNSISIQKYWDNSLSTTPINSEKEIVDELDMLLKSSIEMELISDVPIGSFLSGGIDSSIVTTLASELCQEEFSVFHMRWHEIPGKIDESMFAEKVIQNKNVSKYFRDVNNIDVLNLLPKLIYHLDEPFADAAFLPTYYLANIASEKVKVILSGAGGDELFGGYPHHTNYSKIKSMINGMLGRKALAYSYFDIWRSEHQNKWKQMFPWYKKSIFKNQFEHKWKNNKDIDSINAIMLNDIEFYLQDNILFLTDKMTMATSIECRVPLLDHRIVELSHHIPSFYKVKGNDRKHIFKKWALKYLPSEVLYRQKEGFGFPIEIWINKYKELYFDLLLENGFLISNQLVNKQQLQKLFIKTELTRTECWFYWQILVLEIWFQIFINNVSHNNLYDL